MELLEPACETASSNILLKIVMEQLEPEFRLIKGNYKMEKKVFA